MKKHFLFTIRLIAVGLIAALLVAGFNRIATPKYYYDQTWPTTTTLEGFYQMEENTVDLLFLGTSHAMAAYNPQVIYDETGLHSYNLGTEQQNLLTSYYWLQEALQYQDPQVVVLDTYLVFPFTSAETLNSEESCTRKAFDAMKWSSVKWEAVNAICDLDPSQSLRSYIFPNLRYHTRWKELTEDDFSFSSMEAHYELKGFTPLNWQGGSADYTPFAADSTAAGETFHPVMAEYLEKIIDLCEENDIELILVDAPANNETEGQYTAMRDFAASKGLTYIDFNAEDVYSRLDFDFANDMKDDGHCNIWGAAKVSSYLGKILADRVETTAAGDAQWSETEGYYNEVLADCNLMKITDFHDYLAAIDQDRYTVLIAVMGDATAYLDAESLELMQSLGSGLQVNLTQYDSYVAAVHEGESEEEASQEAVSLHGSTRERLLDYQLTSTGANTGNSSCSILIDNADYAIGKFGINIVVYSNATQKVVDTIAFDGAIERW